MATATEYRVSEGGTNDLKDFAKAFRAFGDKTKSDLRRVGFAKADTNGSGQASLAEVENFIKSALESKHKDEATSDRLFKLFRPSYRYAFNNAKNLTSGKGSSSDYISYGEFRVFTIYLRIYAEMFDIFCHIDGGESRDENDDSRIELDEFCKQSSSLQTYNFISLQRITSQKKAIELFHKVDSDGGGRILFSEWSSYLKNEEMKANTNTGILLSGKLKPTILSPPRKTKNTGFSFASSSAAIVSPEKNAPGMPKSITVSGVYSPGIGASNDLRAYIYPFLPLAEKTGAGIAQRREAFRSCDGNGSGQCGLAEVDGFVLERLKQSVGLVYAKDLFDRFRPSIIRAFNNAKDVVKGSSDDYITFSEFRILNAYLCIYAGMYDLFSKIDGGGAGISEDDDRRMSKQEWVDAFPVLKDCGFKTLNSLKSRREAEALFSRMDADGAGKVLLAEFCRYIRDAEYEARTGLGKLLNLEVLERKISSPNKSLKKVKRQPNLIVASSYTPGQTASSDLVDFIKVFQPYAENDTQFDLLRERGFAIADPNNNGYCSLAELENYMTVVLKKAYSIKSNRPHELFRRFRKSYLYAFNAARALDSHHGSHDGVSDAYITSSEFRMFNAYLCIYAGMLDGFYTIDGTGNNGYTDKKIDEAEFIQRIKAVNDHGFSTVAKVSTERNARKMFKSIDTSSSGMIAHNEWFSYLTKAEIDEKTKVGQLLQPAQSWDLVSSFVQ